MIKFKFLTGDVCWQEYGGKFISKKFNNGEFDYYYVMEVINWYEFESSPAFTYHVQLSVIAPSEFDEIESAINSCGWDGMDLNDDLMLVELISSYAGGALIWQESGNNIRSLMKAARKEAALCNMLFGFYLDRNQNAIGSTGWDLLQGNILARLYK